MFNILFVCTGNRCRSPVAKAAVDRSRRTLPVSATSAGILDLGDAPSPPETIAAAASLGLELSSHRSRMLTSEAIQRAQLVIGFDGTHVAHAVVEGSADYEKVFLLKEIVRLMDDIEPPPSPGSEERANEIVRLAHRERERRSDFIPGEEIGDPLGRPRAVQQETAQVIVHLTRSLLSGLFGQDGPRQ